MSLHTTLASTMKRLAVRRMSPSWRNLSMTNSNFLIPSQQIRKLSHFHIGLNRVSFQGSAKVLYQPVAEFHRSSTRNRGETSIDESLNRLDGEIRRWGRIRRYEVDEVLEDIKEMRKATSSQSLMMIRCCGELIPEEPPNSRTELVRQVWKTLVDLNVPMDISHYNALLRVYLENEHKFNPTEILQDLTNKGIEPNRVTYQRLIARYCQDGDIDGASTILQHMKEKQMPINEYVFNALILGHGQANDMESAEGILTVMQQAGLEPNDDTYVTLMTSYAKQGDLKNIQRIVKECEEKEIFLIDRDFLKTIAALAENNHDHLIDDILPYLKKHSGFNQEATNLIFRLINLGHEETAYKMLKQLTPLSRQGSQMPSGNFFIKHLIRIAKPADVVIKYCKALQADQLHDYALIRAAEFALLAQKFDLAVDLFNALSTEGHSIRQHYFWPMFAQAKSEKDVYFALQCMKEVGLTPNAETLREYAIPKLLSTKRADETLENTLHKFSSSAAIPLSSVATAALFHLLSNGDMAFAVNFANMFRIPFGNVQMRRAIVHAYLLSKNASAFVKIIGSSALDGGDEQAREYIGMMLMELVSSIHSSAEKRQLLEPVLKELLSHGLGLSNSGSELLQNNLGEALTPELANIIIQLTSSDLTPTVSLVSDSRRSMGAPGGMEEKSTEELEQMLADAVRRNAPTRGIKKGLLYSYCRDKNVEKASKLKDELTNESFVFSPGMYAMLLDLYIHAGDIQQSKAQYEEIKKSLDFVMDDLKILRFAHLLQSNGEFDECMDVLKNTPRDETRKPQGAAQQATVWKLLNSVAESSPEKVNEVFNLLESRGLAPVNNMTLGPLVKAYLNKDDVAGALEEFERCVSKYNVTPWKQELFCRFIKSEDADRLQKVMDLSTSVHGEVNSMYDLVFAFIDCGKLRQARKILETPGLRARNDKIEMYCQRYFNDMKVAELVNLIEVTKDLMDVDRSSMYFYLLQTYCKLGDADKALSVWTTMQEENVQPSVELLVYLADFLRKNNRPIPFVVPDASEISFTSSTSSPHQSDSSTPGLPKSVVEFRRCIDMNEVDKALQIKQRLDAEGSSLSIADLSGLIEKLARAERLNEATRLTEQLMEQSLHPYPRVLKFLVTRLGSAGDVSSLERMEGKLSPNMKGAVMYNSRLCLAYVNANRGEEFFQNRIKKAVESASLSNDSSDSDSSSSDEELQRPEEQEDVGIIPVFGCVKLLVKNEHLVPEFEALISNSHAVHKRVLTNALWGFHMIKKEFNKAKQIWDSHLKDEERVLFRSVMIEARQTNDADMAVEAFNQLSSSHGLPSSAKSLVAASAIDILGSLGRVDEALNLFDDSLKSLKLEDYPAGYVGKVKLLAESNNKSFKYAVPSSR